MESEKSNLIEKGAGVSPAQPDSDTLAATTLEPTLPAREGAGTNREGAGANGGGGRDARPTLKRRAAWAVAGLLLIAIAVFAIWRMAVRGTAAGLEANSASLPSVAVAQVTREDLYNEETIPAEFRPYQEVELHAKVSGYVSEMKVDFGDRVKAGQLLATLEVPELLDQLHNAVANQQKAEADHRSAHLNYTRLKAVAKDNANLVAQQDLDAAQAKDGAAEAAIAAAKADVEKFQTMESYTRILAPFDGVVTHRYVDPGTLIQAGTASETQSLPIVRVSDNYRLRLDFPVSVKYVKDVRVGAKADVRVESLGKTLSGTITRTTRRVNDQTRTMTTELEVPNPELEIVPGMYASVSLKVLDRPNSLSAPLEAVALAHARGQPDWSETQRKGTVYLVNASNQIEERSVTVGIETPGRYEIISGLQEGDRIMIGDKAQVQPGQKVTPVRSE